MKHKSILFLGLLLITLASCGQQTTNDDSFSAQGGTAIQNRLETVSETLNEETVEQPVQTKNDEYTTSRTDNARNTGDTAKDNPATGAGIFEISKISGTVTEFFADGCKITPTKYSGDNEAYEAAAGYEDEQDLVSIVYDTDCTFQVAHISMTTGKATYDDANMDDVKKQTPLIICGEYDEDNILHASRVFIYRSERE